MMPPLVAVLFALTPPCTHHPRHVAPCIPIYGEEGAGAGREDGAERGRGQGKERAKYAAPWPGPENTFEIHTASFAWGTRPRFATRLPQHPRRHPGFSAARVWLQAVRRRATLSPQDPAAAYQHFCLCSATELRLMMVTCSAS